MTFINKNIIENSLTKILENDCEFFDKNVHKLDDYFGYNDYNIKNNNNKDNLINNDFDEFQNKENEKKDLTPKSTSRQNLKLSSSDLKNINEEGSILSPNKSELYCQLNIENINDKLKGESSKLSITNNSPIILNFDKQSIINKNNNHHQVNLNNVLLITKPSKQIKSKDDIKNSSKNEVHQITLKDYTALSLKERLKYDRRSFFKYLTDHIRTEHPLISIIFKRSLLEPVFIRYSLFMYSLIMNFAINAVMFSDDYIDIRAQSASSRVT